MKDFFSVLFTTKEGWSLIYSLIMISLMVWFGYWFVTSVNDAVTTLHQIHEVLMEINNG